MDRTKQGQAPFGYRWQGGQLRLNEAEAETRRAAFDLFLTLRSKSAVARALNEQRRYTRSGKLWSDVQVGRILECPSAIGRYETNRSKVGDDGKRTSTRAGSRIVVDCDPIIAKSVWIRVAEFLGAKRLARKAEPGASLCGVVRCQCGAEMSYSTEDSRFACRKCATSLHQEDLEAIFSADFGAIIHTHPELMLGLSSGSPAGALAVEVARAEGALAELKAERAAAEKMYGTAAISKRRFEQLHQPVETKIADAEKNLAALKRKLATAPVASETPSWECFWNGLPTERRIRLMRAFVSHFTVGVDEIEIAYLLPESEPSGDSEPASNSSHASAPVPISTGGPVYIRLPKPGELCPYTGLSRAKMNELILPSERNNFRPPVASKSLRQPGQQRGVRLILLESLMSYLHTAG